MNRCTRCILPETVPGLSLDDEGVCNFCRDYRKIEYEGEGPLLAAFDRARRRAAERGCEYDCIVPLSGGRDSSFMIHFAASHDLRTLAVNYDNEFATPHSVENMHAVCAATGATLKRFRSRGDLGRKIVAASVRNALPCGVNTVVGSMCGACNYGFRSVVYDTARRLRIPLILWGDSRIEETTHMTRYARRPAPPLPRRLLGKLRPQNLKARWYQARLSREFPSGNGLLDDLKLAPPALNDDGIEEISPFFYIPWDRRALKDTILNELGWRIPDHVKSTWRTDCRLEPLVTYCFHAIFGCAKNAFGYHNMINEGQMTRDEALAREEGTSGVFTDELERLLVDEFGMTPREIDVMRSFGRPQGGKS
jgi:hypothetical protein